MKMGGEKKRKQVCSNKDASEDRDEDCRERLARFACGLLAADCLQVYCRLFIGYLQVICYQGSISRIFQSFCAVSTQFPRFEKNGQWTNGRTDPYMEMLGRIQKRKS